MAKITEYAKINGFSKWRKRKGITTADSPYQVTGDEQTIIAIVTTGDIEIVLPPEANFKDYQVIEVITKASDTYKVTVKSYIGETFRYGNTKFNIPINRVIQIFGLHAHGHHLRSEIIANIKIVLEDWDASNFSSLTTIPFDTVDVNNQEEFFTLNTTTGALRILATGVYDFSAMFAINSTGGSTWLAYATIYVNGVEVPNTKIRTGNDANEDQMMTGIAWGLNLTGGDLIEIKLEQKQLVGRLEFGYFSARVRLG